MIVSPETASRIAIFRQKAEEGTLTQEEMREAIQLLRGDRLNAIATKPGASRSRVAKAKAVIPSADELLGELSGL